MKKTVIILSVVLIIVCASSGVLYVRTQKLQAANRTLSVNLSHANSQLAEANSEFMGATSELAEINSQLSAANQEIAKMKPDVQRARTMPISITRRAAMVNGGYVYTFWNRLRTPLALHVIFTNPAFSQPKEFHLVIDGGVFKNIGWYQGWAGAAGDTVKVECAGYDPLQKTYQ